MSDSGLLKVRCPVCRNFSRWKDNPYRPFCGESCKNRDLGNWATEAYRIPGAPQESDSEKTTPESPKSDPETEPESEPESEND